MGIVEGQRERERERERENSNLKTLFYKDCSLGSVRETEWGGKKEKEANTVEKQGGRGTDCSSNLKNMNCLKNS